MSTRKLVVDLANRRGIAYVKTNLDIWAESITRLSGDEVVLEETEELILALVRAGVIDEAKAIELQVLYLREMAAHDGSGLSK